MRILLIWEMGANMGHIDRLLVCARGLREQGHEVRFLLRDLSRAHSRVSADGFAMGQAPIWLPRLANPPRLANYAAVLAAAGWMDSGGLCGLVTAWRDAIALARPDLLVCDHSPTAVLAARSIGLPVVLVGNSFEVPPPGTVFPPMLQDDPTEGARCAGYDALVLPHVNRALERLGAAPLQRLPDVFDSAVPVLASVPELDHYDGYAPDAVRMGLAYIGDVGVAPQWPSSPAGAAPGRRVFVYLSPEHAAFNPLMAALRRQSATALVHAKGLSPQAATRLGGPGLHFEAEPVSMDAAVRDADLVVSHASMGTASAALLAGKPQLVVPSQDEQAMVARRVQQAGIGLVLPRQRSEPGRAPPDPAPLLQRLFADPGFGARAR
ncbi:MAG: nucleotide disphospho-sugar-binding domain-containing protein, partial [Rubrivivax sp.]